MSLDKSFTPVVYKQEESRREIAQLTVLDESDKNTIYNLIFAKRRMEEDLMSNANKTVADL